MATDACYVYRAASKQLQELHSQERQGMENEETGLLLQPDEYESPEDNTAKAELQVC